MSSLGKETGRSHTEAGKPCGEKGGFQEYLGATAQLEADGGGGGWLSKKRKNVPRPAPKARASHIPQNILIASSFKA